LTFNEIVDFSVWKLRSQNTSQKTWYKDFPGLLLKMNAILNAIYINNRVTLRGPIQPLILPKLKALNANQFPP